MNDRAFLSGLWMADLSVTQIMQESKGAWWAGLQLNQLLSMIKDLMVIDLLDPRIFSLLIIASWISIFCGYVSYMIYSADQDEWQIDALRRAQPADGQNIGVDSDMTRRGVGGHRRAVACLALLCGAAERSTAIFWPSAGSARRRLRAPIAPIRADASARHIWVNAYVLTVGGFGAPICQSSWSALYARRIRGHILPFHRQVKSFHNCFLRNDLLWSRICYCIVKADHVLLCSKLDSLLTKIVAEFSRWPCYSIFRNKHASSFLWTGFKKVQFGDQAWIIKNRTGGALHKSRAEIWTFLVRPHA